MNRRLHSKHQRRHSHSMSNESSVPRDGIPVYRENVVEQFGAGKEPLEMNAIFPVPKQTGDTEFLRIGNHFAKGVIVPLRPVRE